MIPESVPELESIGAVGVYRDAEESRKVCGSLTLEPIEFVEKHFHMITSPRQWQHM